MRAGLLRHRITIERPTGSLDSYGQQTGWETVIANLPASVTPLDGRELALAKEMHAEVTHEVSTRERWMEPIGVRPDMRILFTDQSGSHILNVLSVLNVDQRSRELRITCREKVG